MLGKLLLLPMVLKVRNFPLFASAVLRVSCAREKRASLSFASLVFDALALPWSAYDRLKNGSLSTSGSTNRRDGLEPGALSYNRNQPQPLLHKAGVGLEKVLHKNAL